MKQSPIQEQAKTLLPHALENHSHRMTNHRWKFSPFFVLNSYWSCRMTNHESCPTSYKLKGSIVID